MSGASASTLKAYLGSRVFDNFVSVFNQWAVSSKLSSMRGSRMSQIRRKVEEGRVKRFEVEKIYSLSDVPTRMDFSEKPAWHEQNSELAHSYIDEIPFAANEEVKNYAQKSMLDLPAGLKLSRENSLNSLDDATFKFLVSGFSNTFSNVSGDWGSDK